MNFQYTKKVISKFSLPFGIVTSRRMAYRRRGVCAGSDCYGHSSCFELALGDIQTHFPSSNSGWPRDHNSRIRLSESLGEDPKSARCERRSLAIRPSHATPSLFQTGLKGDPNWSPHGRESSETCRRRYLSRTVAVRHSLLNFLSDFRKVHHESFVTVSTRV